MASITASASRRLFIGGAVFDGDRLHQPGLGVLVVDGVVEKLAPVADFEGFAGAVEDTSGGTLMPGLVDAHLHLTFGADDDPDEALEDLGPQDLIERITARAQASLMGGIVALRDCGGMGDAEYVVRDRIADARIPGPRIRACGPIVRPGTDGFGDAVARPAPDRDSLLEAVRQLALAGADFINVMATEDPFSRPAPSRYGARAIADAVTAAGRLGRSVASNAQNAEDVAAAAAAGVVSIEQGSGLDAEGMEIMLDRGVVLVPCLLARRNINAGLIDRGAESQRIDQALALEERTRAACRQYAGAGGPVAMGTDCGAPGTPHGSNAGELALLVAAGLSPVQALRAATRNAAELMRLDDGGRIARGARADLLLVDGDPTRDIGSVADRSRHRDVFLKGTPVREPGARPAPA